MHITQIPDSVKITEDPILPAHSISVAQRADGRYIHTMMTTSVQGGNVYHRFSSVLSPTQELVTNTQFPPTSRVEYLDEGDRVIIGPAACSNCIPGMRIEHGSINCVARGVKVVQVYFRTTPQNVARLLENMGCLACRHEGD